MIRKFRVTITAEYKADSDWYGGITDAETMIEIDKENTTLALHEYLRECTNVDINIVEVNDGTSN